MRRLSNRVAGVSMNKSDTRESSLADNSKQRIIPDELKESDAEIIARFPARDDFLEAVLEEVGEDPQASDYVYQIASLPALDEAQTTKLLQERGDDPRGARALKRLSEAHMRIAVWIAKDYDIEGLTFMELVNDGIVGLLQAVKTYEGKDMSFEEYIFCVVKESISLSVLAESQSKQVPQYILDKINSIKEITVRLREENGVEPTHEEIAQDMGFSLEELNRLINLAKLPVNADN